MEKPITLLIEDFKKELASVINHSTLHPYILDNVVGQLYNEVHMLYEKQCQEDEKRYKENLIDQKDKFEIKEEKESE